MDLAAFIGFWDFYYGQLHGTLLLQKDASYLQSFFNGAQQFWGRWGITTRDGHNYLVLTTLGAAPPTEAMMAGEPAPEDVHAVMDVQPNQVQLYDCLLVRRFVAPQTQPAESQTTGLQQAYAQQGAQTGVPTGAQTPTQTMLHQAFAQSPPAFQSTEPRGLAAQPFASTPTPPANFKPEFPAPPPGMYPPPSPGRVSIDPAPSVYAAPAAQAPIGLQRPSAKAINLPQAPAPLAQASAAQAPATATPATGAPPTMQADPDYSAPPSPPQPGEHMTPAMAQMAKDQNDRDNQVKAIFAQMAADNRATQLGIDNANASLASSEFRAQQIAGQEQSKAVHDMSDRFTVQVIRGGRPF